MERREARFYTASEVAGMLKVHVSTVRQQAAAGQLPAKRFGRLWRFPKERIDAMLELPSRGESRNPAGDFPFPASQHTAKAPVEELPSLSIGHVLALAKVLHPIIQQGTQEPVDVVADLQALRKERDR